jgi:glutathione peroxidase-family protein
MINKIKKIKLSKMKKIILSAAVLCLALFAQAQSNAIDEMFNKYSEKEGFTVVTISSKMFNMFSSGDKENADAGNIINKLKSIRILSVEDSLLNATTNFYSELSKKIDLSVYEELMVVKEGPNITKFLIKQKGNTINELLVLTGGPGGNSLISIQGDLDMKSLSNISKDIGIRDLENLDKVDEKSQKTEKKN